MVPPASAAHSSAVLTKHCFRIDAENFGAWLRFAFSGSTPLEVSSEPYLAAPLLLRQMV
jgi:hypothetical protein